MVFLQIGTAFHVQRFPWTLDKDVRKHQKLTCFPFTFHLVNLLFFFFIRSIGTSFISFLLHHGNIEYV